MNATCTIITADYLHYALALNESLLKFHSFPFYVLIVDDKIEEESMKAIFPNIHFLYLENINQTDIAQKIIKKYQGVYEDALRWSLKPVLINYLLNQHEKVLFLDCDLYFYNDYQFLFDELEENNLILTPHWRNSTPYTPYNSFQLLFTSGLFNAGFIGGNKYSKEIMDWWAMCCEYKCEINTNEGHYDDQTYLNLMPIYFDKVKILRHKGCNISEWNYEECKRTQMADGTVFINEKYPIIFIHFIKYLILDIQQGKDILLSHHLTLFESSLNTYKIYSEPYKLKKVNNETEKIQKNITSKKEVSLIKKIKRKLRIRTRIKRFLEG